MATKTKAPAAAIPIDFAQIAALLGVPEDDAKVTALLAKAGKVTWTKPDGGERYAQARQAGFDLLVKRPDDAKRTAPKVVDTIFLYCEGRDKHAQFAKPPFGVTFTTRDDVLKTLGKPERSWIIGKGAVPVKSKGVDHDRWFIDGMKVSVDYNDEGAVRGMQISLAKDD